MNNRTTFVLAIVAFALAACAGAVQGQDAAASGTSIDNGKGAYRSAGCQRCHGANGQDGTEGPALAPDPIPVEEFNKVVREGKGGGMPAFDTTKLNDAELANIYAFLKTVR